MPMQCFCTGEQSSPLHITIQIEQCRVVARDFLSGIGDFQPNIDKFRGVLRNSMARQGRWD